MAKRPSILLLAGCTLLMLAAAGETAEVQSPSPRSLADRFPSPEQTNHFLRGQTNGDWAVWIEVRHVGSPYARVQRFEQKLYRHGPTNIAPQLLMIAHDPPGGVLFWLGPDGLLVAQSFRGRPLVYFPGRDKPQLLEVAQPAKTNSPNPPKLNLDRCWFFDNVLVYDSGNYEAVEYLVGLCRIDPLKQAVSPGRICLEVRHTNGYLVRTAQVVDDRILHIGTHLLWENVGTQHSRYPESVEGTWRTRQLRAIDLKSGQLLTGSEIPPALLARHKDSVARVFGSLKFH